MKSLIKFLNIIIALILFNVASFAQEYSLKGRSALELNIGFWGGAKASNTFTGAGVQSEAKTSGFLGGIQYSHWLSEQLSLELSVGFLAGEANSTVSYFSVSQHSSVIIPFLFGVNYYIINPITEDAVRPFIFVALGPYMGYEASNTVISQEAHSESVFGGRFGAGIDFLLSNHFKLGVNAGYNIMSDFTAPVGSRKNYNGANCTIGIGYIF